jgi:superfamily II DNA/RNA helicase
LENYSNYVNDQSDVDDVKFVINYDYPITSQDYIHRIGRTGRCSQTGTAFTFFTKKNSAKAADLIKVLTDSNQVINPMLYEMTGNRGFLNNNKRSKFHPFKIYKMSF